MKLIVNPHKIEIIKEPVNEREIDITKCEFEFADEITNDYVKEAYFTFKGNTYKQIIFNNECDIPSEVLTEQGQVEIGVVAFLVENEQEIKRYNPSPAYFNTWVGSLKDNAENSEPITPSEMEQYEQQLQEGLNDITEAIDTMETSVNNKLEEVDTKLETVDDKLENIDSAITETNNLDLDISKEGKVATVTLTKKDATTKTVTLSDGTSLQFIWQGTSLGIKTDDMQDYVFVNLQGIQGIPGPQGEPFRIKKTYSSVTEMNADFDNMNVGDYVMIASTVEVEDNAKLYTKGDYQWIFITDFSGATGIKGETGATPIIHIGTVTSGDEPSVTISGTAENPIFNFVLKTGPQGNTGPQGQTGPTGNGIASISKTSTSGLVDTYTITYTNGNTSTFEVTNGEDGEVTQTQLDETNARVDRAELVYNALPKVSGEGTDITINDTAECPMPMELQPSTLEQATAILPAEYTQVDYLESSGTQYIDTGFKSNQDTRVIIKAQKVSGENYDTGARLFGARTNTYQKCFFMSTSDYNTEAGSLWVSYTDSGIALSPLDENSHILDFNKNLFYIDNILLHTFTYSNFATDYNAILFGANSAGTIIAKSWKIYECKIYDNGVLIRYLIPCYRNSDNEVGMYDLVNNVFYTNAGTGVFTYGAVVSIPNPDYPQDIHTISGDNTIKVQNKNLITTENHNLGIGSGGAITSISGRNAYYCQAKPNTTYYITRTGVGTASYWWVAFTDTIPKGGITALSYRNMGNTTLQDNITSPEGTKYIAIFMGTGISENVMVSTLNNVSYIPHKEYSLPLNLGDLEYCKIGNYADEFYKATESDTGLTAGKWYLKKNIGIRTITTVSEVGTASSGIKYAKCGVVSNAANSTMIYCSKYIRSTNATTPNSIRILPSGALYVYDNRFTDTDVALSYLNGLKCYYQLDTSEYTLLDSTLQTQLDNIYNWAISYQDQTNISQVNDDLPFNIKAKAVRDMSSIFDLITGTEL